MLGGLNIAEPGAADWICRPLVIGLTIRQKLPEGVNARSSCSNTGFLDAVVPRKELESVRRVSLDLLIWLK